MEKLRVTMPNGSKWDVPVEVIVSNRARYYAENDTGQTEGEEYQKVYTDESEYAMNSEDCIVEWAENNMDWSDVSEYAVLAEKEPTDYFQEGWLNGKKEFL